MWSRVENIPRQHALALALKILQDNFSHYEEAVDHVCNTFDNNSDSFLDDIDPFAVPSSDDDDNSYSTSASEVDSVSTKEQADNGDNLCSDNESTSDSNSDESTSGGSTSEADQTSNAPSLAQVVVIDTK